MPTALPSEGFLTAAPLVPVNPVMSDVITSFFYLSS